MTHQAAMTAPLTAEQAREQLRELADKLTRGAPLYPTIAVRTWTAQNIGKRRVEAMLDECQSQMWDQGTEILLALDVLTREPQPARATWLERLRALFVGGPSV